MATCRDCKLFDLEAAKDKAGRVQPTWQAQCNWKSQEQYPISVDPAEWRRPQPWYVTANDGNGCPCFQKRVKK